MKEQFKKLRSVQGKDANPAWRKALVMFLAVFAVAMAYAVVRYNVFKGVDLGHIPLYISNKALALSSVVFIGLSYALGPLCRFWPKTFVPKLYLKKYFGLIGFGSAAAHGLISLLLFNPAYYPKFFAEAGKLTMEGEFSMLFGIIALFIFAIDAITSIPSIAKAMDFKQWLYVQHLGYFAFLLVLLHVGFMGFKGWFKPQDWPGGLYPITLIAAVVIGLVILLRIVVALAPNKVEKK